MIRTIALAAIAAAGLGIAAIGASTTAQADHWRGHRAYYDYGYRHGHGYYGGPRAWRYERWRRHHDAPYYYGRRPVPHAYGWAPGRVQVVPVIPR